MKLFLVYRGSMRRPLPVNMPPRYGDPLACRLFDYDLFVGIWRRPFRGAHWKDARAINMPRSRATYRLVAKQIRMLHKPPVRQRRPGWCGR